MSDFCPRCGRFVTKVDHCCVGDPLYRGLGPLPLEGAPQGDPPYRIGPIRTDVKDLEEFLVLKYPEEVGIQHPKSPESAVQVAIRLLGEYAEVRRIINSGFFEDSVDVHTGGKTRRIKRNG